MRMMESFCEGRISLYSGDCLEVLKGMPENSIDSVVCDPPYHLTSIVKRFGGDNASPAKIGKTGAYARASAGFMGKTWDGGDVAFRVETWAEVFRVLKPGAHLVAFSGTRTYHRMACSIEDAGFEIRDQLAWVYGSGFPKSLNISKQIDKALGAVREKVRPHTVIAHQRNIGNRRPYMDDPNHMTDSDIPATPESEAWEGWGTALKPAQEPICLARKPLSKGTVAANVLKWGTGALNIDRCRVAVDLSVDDPRLGGKGDWSSDKMAKNVYEGGYAGIRTGSSELGRWPANLIHDGSDEVLAAFPDAPRQQYYVGPEHGERPSHGIYGDFGARPPNEPRNDGGSAARFFYTAKADSNDRIGSKHPTVKPVDLMQWLVRLVTPPKGTVLDCFAGTGTTGEAAYREGFNAVLIEREAEYQTDIRRRMALILAGPDERSRESIKARGLVEGAGPLFDRE